MLVVKQRGFIDIALLTNPWVLAILAFIFATYSVVIYTKGYNSGYAEYLQFKSEVDAASAQAEAANQQRQLEAEREGSRIRDAYKSQLDSLHNSYNSRLNGLQRELRGCETMSRVAASTAGLNERAANAGSAPTTFEETCIKLEQDCAATTLQTVHLQQYVRKVCK